MRLIPFLLTGIALFAAGCLDREKESPKSTVLQTYASVPPLANIVSRIGGERIAVESLSGPGQDPHVLQLKPAQVVALGKAQIFFAVGMPFERTYLPKIESETLAVVDTAAGIELLEGECDHEEHEIEGEDHHHETDPHIWLSPKLLAIQAGHIAAALEKADPEGGEVYQKNLGELQAELAALDAEIAAMLAPHRAKSFYVFHPAFAYFAEEYKLVQHAVESGGQKPTPGKLVALIAQAKEHEAKVIFSQPQFDQRSAEAIAKETGAKVVPMDPLAPDVIENLRAIAKALDAALK